MLAAGKITADEAEELLTAVETADRPADASSSSPKGKPKFLRIVVEPREGSTSGERVNIRVPLMLVKAGMKMSSLIPRDARLKVDETLRDKGINLNLAGVKPEQLDEFLSALQEMNIDVEDEDDKVHISCE